LIINRNRAAEIGRNGIKKVKSKFDINVISKIHLEYYNQVLGF